MSTFDESANSTIVMNTSNDPQLKVSHLSGKLPGKLASKRQLIGVHHITQSDPWFILFPSLLLEILFTFGSPRTMSMGSLIIMLGHVVNEVRYMNIK
jgi:hypothetical protein